MSERQLAEVRQHSEWHGWYYIVVKSFIKNISRKGRAEILDGRGKPMLAYQWEKKFQRSVEKYNKIYKVELPKITPHICRHSDCHECIHASQIGRCEGRTGADESKGAVKKGDNLGRQGVCQKGNKTSE